MSKPYAIFDMDGTLVDSMPYWKNLGRDYLISKGVEVPDDLRSRLLKMTILETVFRLSRRQRRSGADCRRDQRTDASKLPHRCGPARRSRGIS